jgi:mitochondrial fission protein ELM1
MTKSLPVSSCWIVTEGLAGLQNQAIGLAEALGLPYVVKQVPKPKVLWRLISPSLRQLDPPWPDILISCGRQSEAVSVAVRRASGNKTFTVHIQKPLIDPKQFDVVIVPAHDKMRGENVLSTQGGVTHVTKDKLEAAAKHFRPLLGGRPRPLISVLVGGKNKYQGFSKDSAHDFAQKLRAAVQNSGSLALTFSRRTGQENEALLRQELAGVPSYIWDGQGENPYFGLLALADAIVVTGDSVSMMSEVCATGKPVYIYDRLRAGGRHQEFVKSLFDTGVARPFTGTVEVWQNTALDETRKAADFVRECYHAVHAA